MKMPNLNAPRVSVCIYMSVSVLACVYTGEGLFYSERDVFVMAAQLSSGDV